MRILPSTIVISAATRQLQGKFSTNQESQGLNTPNTVCTYKINDVLVSIVYNGVEDSACISSFMHLCLPMQEGVSGLARASR